MKAHRQFAFVLLLVLSGPHLGAAQSVLFVPLQSQATASNPPSIHLTEVLLTTSGPPSILRQVTIPGSLESSIYTDSLAVSSDGRYVALSRVTGANPNGGLIVLDRRTDALHVLPGLGGHLISDPVNPRFFVDQLGEITVIDARGVRTLSVPGRGAFGRALISSDGRELFLTRVIDTPEGERAALVAVDPDTGQHLRVLVVAASGNPGHARAISADGRRLFIATVGATVKSIGALSGVELASVDVVPAGLNGSVSDLVFDEIHNRLFVALSFRGPIGPTGAIRVLEADSLIEMPVGTYLGSGAATLHADRTTGTVVSVDATYSFFSQRCGDTWVNVWGAAVEPLNGFAAPTDGMCPGPIAAASLPAPPTGLTAAVAGQQATLTWASSDRASGYLVEAGSGPGGSDLAQLTVETLPQLAVNDVPPGTYYVRVRALNEIGHSGPSNEIVVTVP